MLQALRQLERQCRENDHRGITLTAHKDVIEQLRERESETLAKIEKQCGRKITLKTSPDCHLEFFSIIETGSGDLLESS
jgi:Ribonuclease G/E